MSVTATFNNNVPATTVSVVPTLTPYLSVMPQSVPAKSAGSQQAFTLRFSAASSTAPGTLNGTLQLRVGTSTVARPLPIDLRVWQLLVTPSGLKLAHPPAWIESLGDYSVTLSDLTDRSLFNPFTGQDFVSFTVNSLSRMPPAGDVNPNQLPIDQWFSQFFSAGFSSPPKKTNVQVAGRAAIRLEIAEGDGPHAHIYVPNGVDVLEISFRLLGPFTSDYETILKTMSF